jgi:hypothetical protein
MDAVLQKSMDMTVELSETGKSSRPGFPIATIRATQVSSSPVDQDNKNNNSVLISGNFFLFIFIFIAKHFNNNNKKYLHTQTEELATNIPMRTKSRNLAQMKTTRMDYRATRQSVITPRSVIITGNWSEMKMTRRRMRIWVVRRATATVILR